MNFKYLSLSLLICFLISAENISAQRTYKNPILTGMNPDPSICKAGEDFYMVTSTFEYFPGLPIYQSKDLVNWKQIGHALSSKTSNPLTGCVSSSGGQYAPTIRYNNGTFYVIGTNYGGDNTQGIFYVTAKNPAGPWSDPVWIGEWYVDPSLEFINDTLYYLSPDNAGSFLLATLDPETGKFTSSLQKVASGLGGSSPEGPHFYKINDWYYIMSAEGGTGYEHREVIQRSRCPWGPYESSPNNVMSNINDPENSFQAIGHADMIQLEDGSWWAVCLGIRPQKGKFHHLGRETFLAPITWCKDGWPRVGTDGIVKEEFIAPKLKEHKWEKDPVRDDFSSDKLNLFWNFVRNPYAKDWSLTERPGYLRLYGSDINFTKKDSPAFICRRQTAFNIYAETSVDFTPTANTEEAGIVVRGNDKNYYSFVITQRNEKRAVLFRSILNDKEVCCNYKNIEDGDIILQVTADESTYRFTAKDAKGNILFSRKGLTRDLSTEKIGGFTGVYLGPYASGNGKKNTNPADFEWFDYYSYDHE